MKKRVVIPIAALAVILILVIAAVIATRQRVQRHRTFRAPAGEVKPEAPRDVPPVEQWSATFAVLAPDDLADLLERISQKHPDLYAKWSLGYLHARALIENNEKSEAAEQLAPFLAPNSPLRDLALYHHSEIADEAEASRDRQELIAKYPQSPWRDEAIDEEVESLAPKKDALIAFATKIFPSASSALRRDLNARIVESLGNSQEALTKGLALLQGSTTDDASDRVSRILDKPEFIARMNVEQRVTLGETFRNHRHYDRAEALIALALQSVKPPAPPAKTVGAAGLAPPKAPAKKAAAKKAPAKKAAPKKTQKKPTPKKPGGASPAAPPPPAPSKWDDLQFSLGRCYFGDEKYVEAQQTYLRGANLTRVASMKVTFLWHAARAAQLRDDDKTAEQLMTQAIAVPGKYPATLAALTQRLRMRLKQHRNAEAAADLALIRKLAGNERAHLDAALAYAIAMVAANNGPAALSVLNTVPPRLLDEYDRAEFAYWRGRALEPRDLGAAFTQYLAVLRSSAPNHFAYFVRDRLDSPALAPKLARELQVREAQVTNLLNAKQFELAKRIQTDRILLSSQNRPQQLERLRAIYAQLPAYRAVLELKPESLPAFPNAKDDRDSLLMAMGLYDETTGAIEQRWPLAPAANALTRSFALNRGSASKDSIYAIEVMMKRVPEDFVPDLLPRVVRELLYPRYFYDAIADDAKRYGADPVLVLSIMREESRFNPRAKSQAAARGLLQFIITTARDIGRDVGLVDVSPEDLYDPRVIIRLGAKYISELSKTFNGNRYRTSAAYNAGPKQVALWSRTQPAEGDDYFLSSVNFDETKHYVRKVNNSYERYAEIYGNAGPKGGLRVEP
ncbi:MAG TPA: lytic transglycosylase domain-containing protein [Thermoanaerobaculia bacterium]|nr:lytic transglycosylase domain-containing protein [Thermoanaerobaculia bacterium]